MANKFYEINPWSVLSHHSQWVFSINKNNRKDDYSNRIFHSNNKKETKQESTLDWAKLLTRAYDAFNVMLNWSIILLINIQYIIIGCIKNELAYCVLWHSKLTSTFPNNKNETKQKSKVNWANLLTFVGHADNVMLSWIAIILINIQYIIIGCIKNESAYHVLWSNILTTTIPNNKNETKQKSKVDWAKCWHMFMTLTMWC